MRTNRPGDGLYYPSMQGHATTQPINMDSGERTKALLWLMVRGHRDIAIILGLLPDEEAT